MKLKKLFNLLKTANEGLFNSDYPIIWAMRVVPFIFFVSVSLGQWTNFKLDQLSDYSKESEALFRQAGFAATHHYPVEINKGNRIIYGWSIIKSSSSNGFLPTLHSQLKVSWNLYIKGIMAAYSGKEGAVQMYGWGLSFRPGKEDTPSNWIVNFNSGRLYSHDQVRVSALQVNVERKLNLKKLPIHLGFGMNILKANPYLQFEDSYMEKVEIQTNFINVGSSTTFFGMQLIPQIWLAPQYSMVSLTIVGEL